MTHARGLRVAMLTPLYRPEPRGDGERTVHELSAALHARGHRPGIITAHRGRPCRSVENGLPVLRLPRPPSGRLERRLLEDHLGHVPLSYAALRAGRYELAHAWFPTDALAAARWRRLTGRPAIHSYMGVPDHGRLMGKRRRLEITLRAIHGCDVTVALSRHVAQEFWRWLGYEARVIPPPVDVRAFSPVAERAPDPTIVCTASAEEPRTRADLLVRAFGRVRREHPRARLVLNRPSDPALAAQLADPELGVDLVGTDGTAARARLYSAAWVSVLPSIGEAFGLGLAEALACGTPGVGSDRDGIPEVIDRPGIGCLFSGGEEELTRALLEALELSRDRATRDLCRTRALELAPDRCASAYEALYLELLEGRWR